MIFNGGNIVGDNDGNKEGTDNECSDGRVVGLIEGVADGNEEDEWFYD